MSNENFFKAAECELTTSHIRWSCTTFRWRQGNNLCISGFQEASIRIRCQQASHYCFISVSSLHMFLPRGPIFRIDAWRMMAVINERSWQNTNAGKQQELRGMGGGVTVEGFYLFIFMHFYILLLERSTDDSENNTLHVKIGSRFRRGTAENCVRVRRENRDESEMRCWNLRVICFRGI